MAEKAFITPNVLKWARESARISIEIAASKISVSPEKLQEWEDGISQPTIKQAEILAHSYRRPFALFFLPEIPRDFMPLQDFRKSTARELSTASIFIIREIQQKQSWISEVNEDNNEMPLNFVGKFNLKSNPKDVAEDILNTLEINVTRYSANIIKEWINKAEAKGIFVSRTSFIHSRLTLDNDEIQGFAIADKFAPFIFINSKDWSAPQLFTLVHELAHIWIAESGISNEIDIQQKENSKLHPVELFCNEVAANALMPSYVMENLDHADFQSANSILKVAKPLGISTFALLVRALNMNLISLNTYRQLKLEADANFKAFLLKEEEKAAEKSQRSGGPNPYLLRLNKNSRLFTQIVLDAFKGGKIPPTQASSLLNTQVNKFHKLEAFLYS